MPSQKQEFSFPGQTSEELLLIAFGAFLSLGWTLKYAGPRAMIGYTPRRWNKYDDEILVETADGSLSITSSLVHNESLDLLGKNKKHIREFITAFEKVKISGPKEEWRRELETLRAQTIETVAEQSEQAAEVDKVMNFSGTGLYATYCIMAINVIIFILMAIDGAGIFETTGEVHRRWGSNYSSLTLNGEGWRLLTNIFLHFGIIHLAMNTYAFYIAGIYLEPMLGRLRFIAAYLCTGVAASIVSLWWHTEGVNSAGASGAIFGLYGVFIALLLTNFIPKQVRRSLLQSIGIFVVFNLIYGMKAGIDNAAHIGGLVSGLVAGIIYYAILSKKVTISTPVIVAAMVLVTLAGSWLFLKNFKSDGATFQRLQEEIYTIEKKAIESLRVNESTTAAAYKERLINTTLPAWKAGLEKIDQMGMLKLRSGMDQIRERLRKYLELRIEETNILIKAQGAPEGAFTSELEENARKIDAVLKE